MYVHCTGAMDLGLGRVKGHNLIEGAWYCVTTVRHQMTSLSLQGNIRKRIGGGTGQRPLEIHNEWVCDNRDYASSAKH
jgi:hypothetical protein